MSRRRKNRMRSKSRRRSRKSRRRSRKSRRRSRSKSRRRSKRRRSRKSRRRVIKKYTIKPQGRARQGVSEQDAVTEFRYARDGPSINRYRQSQISTNPNQGRAKQTERARQPAPITVSGDPEFVTFNSRLAVLPNPSRTFGYRSSGRSTQDVGAVQVPEGAYDPWLPRARNIKIKDYSRRPKYPLGLAYNELPPVTLGTRLTSEVPTIQSLDPIELKYQSLAKYKDAVDFSKAYDSIVKKDMANFTKTRREKKAKEKAKKEKQAQKEKEARRRKRAFFRSLRKKKK